MLRIIFTILALMLGWGVALADQMGHGQYVQGTGKGHGAPDYTTPAPIGTTVLPNFFVTEKEAERLWAAKRAADEDGLKDVCPFRSTLIDDPDCLLAAYEALEAINVNTVDGNRESNIRLEKKYHSLLIALKLYAWRTEGEEYAQGHIRMIREMLAIRRQQLDEQGEYIDTPPIRRTAG